MARPLPRAPHTTPATQPRLSLRAPVHNPFDKFSQSEFDAWIGDLTGTLRRALGYEPEPEPEPAPAPPASLRDVTREEDHYANDSFVEDSFAEVFARRTKGKGRDPREGPGLGGQDAPIELLSDSEDEKEEHGGRADEHEEEEEEEGEPDQPFFPEQDTGYLGGKDLGLDSGGEVDRAYRGERGSSPAEPYNSGTQLVSVEGVDDGSPHELLVDADEEDAILALPPDEDEVEGEEVEDEVKEVENEIRLTPLFLVEEEGDEQYEESEEYDEDGYENEDLPTHQYPASPWREAVDTEPEVFEVLDSDEEQSEDAVEEEFPPHEPLPTVTPEIPDPWSGPATYAEDFYSGGDVREAALPASGPDVIPSVLDDEDYMYDGIGVGQYEDNLLLEPERNDISIELPDRWAASQAYAEDLYTGGDVPEGTFAEMGATPSHLDDTREAFFSHSYSYMRSGDDREVTQDESFPPIRPVSHSPVEQDHASDHGGDDIIEELYGLPESFENAQRPLSEEPVATYPPESSAASETPAYHRSPSVEAAPVSEESVAVVESVHEPPLSASSPAEDTTGPTASPPREPTPPLPDIQASLVDTPSVSVPESIEVLADDVDGNADAFFASFNAPPTLTDAMFSAVSASQADFGSLPLTPAGDDVEQPPSEHEMMDIAQILADSAMQAAPTIDVMDTIADEITPYIVEEILSTAEDSGLPAVDEHDDATSVTTDVPVHVTDYIVEEVETIEHAPDPDAGAASALSPVNVSAPLEAPSPDALPTDAKENDPVSVITEPESAPSASPILSGNEVTTDVIEQAMVEEVEAPDLDIDRVSSPVLDEAVNTEEASRDNASTLLSEEPSSSAIPKDSPPFGGQQEHLLPNLPEHLQAVVKGDQLPEIPMPVIANPDVVDPADGAPISPYFADELRTPRTPGGSLTGYFDSPVRSTLNRTVTPIATPQPQKLPPSFALRMRARQASDQPSEDSIFTPKDTASPASESDDIASTGHNSPIEQVESPAEASVGGDTPASSPKPVDVTASVAIAESHAEGEQRQDSPSVSQALAETEAVPSTLPVHEQAPTLSYARVPVSIDAWPALLSTPHIATLQNEESDEESANEDNSIESSSLPAVDDSQPKDHGAKANDVLDLSPVESTDTAPVAQGVQHDDMERGDTPVAHVTIVTEKAELSDESDMLAETASSLPSPVQESDQLASSDAETTDNDVQQDTDEEHDALEEDHHDGLPPSSGDMADDDPLMERHSSAVPEEGRGDSPASASNADDTPRDTWPQSPYNGPVDAPDADAESVNSYWRESSVASSTISLAIPEDELEHTSDGSIPTDSRDEHGGIGISSPLSSAQPVGDVSTASTPEPGPQERRKGKQKAVAESSDDEADRTVVHDTPTQQQSSLNPPIDADSHEILSDASPRRPDAPRAYSLPEVPAIQRGNIYHQHVRPAVTNGPTQLPGRPMLPAPKARPPASVRATSTSSEALSSPIEPIPSSQNTQDPEKKAAPVHPGTISQEPPFAHSPVTRSRCTYHKISVEKEDNGPRIFFIVPGCSLVNREFMDQEDIIDHGSAVVEDTLKMEADIASLDMSGELLSNLRLLVGIEREQEIYYLPQKDVPVGRVKRRRQPEPVRTRDSLSSISRRPARQSSIATSALISAQSQKRTHDDAENEMHESAAEKRQRIDIFFDSDSELTESPSDSEYEQTVEDKQPASSEDKSVSPKRSQRVTADPPQKMKSRVKIGPPKSIPRIVISRAARPDTTEPTATHSISSAGKSVESKKHKGPNDARGQQEARGGSTKPRPSARSAPSARPLARRATESISSTTRNRPRSQIPVRKSTSMAESHKQSAPQPSRSRPSVGAREPTKRDTQPRTGESHKDSASGAEPSNQQSTARHKIVISRNGIKRKALDEDPQGGKKKPKWV